MPDIKFTRWLQYDNAVQTMVYGIGNGRRKVETADPEGNVSIQEQDGRGNIVKVSRYGNGSTTFSIPLAEAEYRYNVLGELLEALDSEGNPITVTYDLMGRRKTLETPDMGKKEYGYDRAGNLSWESDGVLGKDGKRIEYIYDSMNRLIKIIYPKRQDTRDVTTVEYRYGIPGEGGNGAGRITEVKDESGEIHYKYGKLGETIEEIRKIKTMDPQRPVTEKRAVMKYRSDYLGRMEEIEYPDGEVVKYGYDEGGQIRSVIGERVGKEFVYVKEIGYDQYGQRIYIEYGNNDTNAQGNPMGGGVKTWYTYDEERRLLKNILSEKEGKIYQDIHYDFDKVGNINGYENNAGRYSTRQEYTYDSLYQLIEAKGTSRQLEYEAGNLEAYKADYIQSFGFDRIGNMTSKVSRESKTNLVRNGMDLNYDFEYTYYKSKEGHKTHKAEQIGNMYYKYDANGNVIEERAGGHRAGDISSIPYYYNNGVYSTEYGFGLSKPGTGKDETAYERVFTWDYRNQLIQSKDNRYTVHYRYGADGQRALKYTEGTRNETLYFNNMWQVSSTNEEERWLQSKHIFVGETRIATKSNYQETDGTTNNNYGFEQVHQYWYHGDHLGSAQLVTNHLGVLHERIEYTPYGELWIEHKYNSDEASLPYRFTGKELDEETNLYYYGARYLDPRTSRWISGDPAMGEYIPGAPINDEVRKQNQNLPGGGGIYNIVNLHVFHYAGNNPVKYVDPDGRDDDLPEWKVAEQKQKEEMDKYIAALQKSTTYQPNPETYQQSTVDRIRERADANLGQKYQERNQCDDWVAKVLTEAGLDASRYFAGDTNKKSVDEHIAAAKSGGNDLPNPSIGANVVFMDEGRSSKYNAHTGLLIVNKDGSAVFYHSSKNNPGGLSRREKMYASVQQFREDFGYNKFHYQSVR
ncbi:hypothetical protein FACS189447_08270 [Spirochaetia bacterium]|nr:hypothetical protein FACS189447_08270 [Spirochaetia bacterium]